MNPRNGDQIPAEYDDTSRELWGLLYEFGMRRGACTEFVDAYNLGGVDEAMLTLGWFPGDESVAAVQEIRATVEKWEVVRCSS